MYRTACKADSDTTDWFQDQGHYLGGFNSDTEQCINLCALVQ
jgi:hypothetical protein